MIKIQKEIELIGKPEYVWEIVTDITNFSRWNPLIKHAAIYGPFIDGSNLKFISGKWDFEFTIKQVNKPNAISLIGKTIGTNYKIDIDIFRELETVRVLMSIVTSGWICKIFRSKTKSAISDFIEIFLQSLKRRVEKGEAAILKHRNEEEFIEKPIRSISMPTPFGSIYRSKNKKKRRKGLK